MSKVKLSGMVTEPYYCDDQWEGATIYVQFEAGDKRIDVRLKISCALLTHFQQYGYEDIERLIMRRIDNALDEVQKKYNITPKDINTIYEIVRLKMQRFVHKSALRIWYIWNAVTGDIRECKD